MFPSREIGRLRDALVQFSNAVAAMTQPLYPDIPNRLQRPFPIVPGEVDWPHITPSGQCEWLRFRSHKNPQESWGKVPGEDRSLVGAHKLLHSAPGMAEEIIDNLRCATRWCVERAAARHRLAERILSHQRAYMDEFETHATLLLLEGGFALPDVLASYGKMYPISVLLCLYHEMEELWETFPKIRRMLYLEKTIPIRFFEIVPGKHSIVWPSPTWDAERQFLIFPGSYSIIWPCPTFMAVHIAQASYTPLGAYRAWQALKAARQWTASLILQEDR